MFFSTLHTHCTQIQHLTLHAIGHEIFRRLIFFTTCSNFRMAYGNESGVAIIDIVQKVCLFNVASPDLYGAQDPYSRVPRSPKRSEPTYSRDEQRSPSIDQVSNPEESLF